MLVIKELKIDGIGGINSLKLNFNEGLNLICGPNGVGKTTILESIGHMFSNGSRSKVKRNVKSDQGSCEISYSTFLDTIHTQSCILRNYEENDSLDWHGGNANLAKEVIVFKAQRSFTYTQLDSLRKDTETSDGKFLEDSMNGIQFFDFKNWFIHRFLFSHVDNELTTVQKENFKLATDCFGILDNSIRFSSVKSDTFDIIISTSNGEIYFEYLSSGFKSCIYIIHGLIKEIEYRFKNDGGIKVQDYEGLILIDELDLHLHPQWQAKMIYLIKHILPKAQIIATTHSPHMVQAAAINELIALGIDEDADVYVRQLPNVQYGFQGWTVEEILEDVMGLDETRSPMYIEAITEFEKSLDEENEEKIFEAYYKLDLMLHPSNPLRKLLKLQVAQFGRVIE
ncbi:AAA family ATPase [Bacillus thuringiensis]|uniref:AAA family ATPase n=1 Tax=Bacillus thuringiensis TaxID=1428 RepID=UPI000BFBE99C|nr:AAA family ATPase [Bacillus thuringiensis]PGK41871.1 recombinase RecF [Bacillus thuringiensis]